MNPLEDSVVLMEELLQDFFVDLCQRSCKQSQRKAPKTLDFLNALAQNPKQLHRAKELLVMDKELKSARAMFDGNFLDLTISGRND